jgi:hypothetical protein
VTYYLGALGNLVALPDPEAGLSMPVERIGGSHQLLSGAKVRDTLGYSRSWQLSWTAITNAQYGLLEGFLYGATGAGPFYFADDEQTNLLPLNVSTGTDTTGDATGFTGASGASVLSQAAGSGNWNSMGGPFPANGTRTMQTSIPNGTAANAAVAFVTSVPIVAGQPYTFSVYLNTASGNAFGVYGQVNWLASDGTTSVGVNNGNTILPATTNGRSTVTATAPATAVYARCQFRIAAANSSGSTQFVYSDGWQFEQASAASTWQPGVPMPLVTVESLSRSTPLAGICDAQMTLVQVG